MGIFEKRTYYPRDYDPDTGTKYMSELLWNENWEDNRTPFKDEGMGVYPIISDGELYGYVCCPGSDMSAEMTMIVCYLSAAVGD